MIIYQVVQNASMDILEAMLRVAHVLPDVSHAFQITSVLMQAMGIIYPLIMGKA
jgi:hypothetical protein